MIKVKGFKHPAVRCPSCGVIYVPDNIDETSNTATPWPHHVFPWNINSWCSGCEQRGPIIEHPFYLKKRKKRKRH